MALLEECLTGAGFEESRVSICFQIADEDVSSQLFLAHLCFAIMDSVPLKSEALN